MSIAELYEIYEVERHDGETLADFITRMLNEEKE